MTNLTPDPNASEPADLTARLRSLGEVPVEPALASAHLTAMANERIGRVPRPIRARFVRSRVVAAFAAGLLLGGTSLASAGALGTTPQNTVADAAARVGVDLPGGTPRSTEGCGGNTYKNHGQFVSQGGDPRSQCGKPLKSAGKAGGAGKSDDAEGKAGADAGKGCGKPPWAGKGNQAKKTPAAVAARSAQCGNDGTDSKGKADAPAARGTGSPRTTTTTTAAPTTTAATTTTVATTTTTIAATTTTMTTSTTTSP